MKRTATAIRIKTYASIITSRVESYSGRWRTPPSSEQVVKCKSHDMMHRRLGLLISISAAVPARQSALRRFRTRLQLHVDCCQASLQRKVACACGHDPERLPAARSANPENGRCILHPTKP